MLGEGTDEMEVFGQVIIPDEMADPRMSMVMKEALPAVVNTRTPQTSKKKYQQNWTIDEIEKQSSKQIPIEASAVINNT